MHGPPPGPKGVALDAALLQAFRLQSGAAGAVCAGHNLGFFAVNPAVAQNDAKVTASDVVDRDSINVLEDMVS